MALHIAVVQAKCKLLNVAVKVLRACVMVDAMQTTLQHGPDAFDAVGAHTGTGILTVLVANRIVVVDIL